MALSNSSLISIQSLTSSARINPIGCRRLKSIRASTQQYDDVIDRDKNSLYKSSSISLQQPFPSPKSCLNKKILDRWVQESIVEIVKNIKDAPFLHFIYDSKVAKPEMRKVSQDVFKRPDCWSALEVGPDGLILVQKLDEKTAGYIRQETNRICTDVWGVLVQGNSVVWSSCYILQTTRVSVGGVAACTRFSLTKAQCFGPAIQSQIENMWLL